MIGRVDQDRDAQLDVENDNASSDDACERLLRSCGYTDRQILRVAWAVPPQFKNKAEEVRKRFRARGISDEQFDAMPDSERTAAHEKFVSEEHKVKASPAPKTMPALVKRVAAVPAPVPVPVAGSSKKPAGSKSKKPVSSKSKTPDSEKPNKPCVTPLTEVEIDAAIDATTNALETMNEHLAVCRIGSGHMVADIPIDRGEQITFMDGGTLHALLAPEKITLIDDNNIPKKAPVSRVWWSWEKRNTYFKAPVFDPSDTAGPEKLNLWRGFGVEPKAGDWSLLRNHVFHVICRSNPLWFAYLMCWLADIFQNPATKPGVAFNLSGKKGTGKSKTTDWVRKMMPANSASFAKGEQVWGKHNAAIQQCLLAVLEEPFWAGDKATEGQLKDLITSATQMIEPKFVDPFQIDNFTRPWLNTNEPWSFPASGDERRVFCLQTSNAHRRDIPYFRAIDAQMKDGGLEGMMFDLLHLAQPQWIELRLPPETPWLIDQIEYSLPLDLAWLRSILTDGVIPSDQCSTPLAWPDDEEESSTTSNTTSSTTRADEIEKAFSKGAPFGFVQHAGGGIDVPCDVVRDAFRKFVGELKRTGCYTTPEQLGAFLARFGVAKRRVRLDKKRVHVYSFPALDVIRASFTAETRISFSAASVPGENTTYADHGTEGIDAAELQKWRGYGDGGSLPGAS